MTKAKILRSPPGTGTCSAGPGHLLRRFDPLAFIDADDIADEERRGQRQIAQTMACYLFIASTLHPFDRPPMPGADVYDLMMSHQCWEVTASAPHFKKMKPGDTLIFYLGGAKARYIAGEAVIAADPTPITKDSPVTFDRTQIPYFSSRLPLRDIVRYEPGRVGLGVVEKLSFARDSKVERKYLGLLLRNGCRILTSEDLDLIRVRSNG